MDWTAPGRGRAPRILCLTLLAGVATLAHASTATAAACADSDVAPVFNPWGDDASYAPVPGGTFEGDAAWQTTGDALPVPESDPYSVGGPSRTSLRLGREATATSPSFCINNYAPMLRFVAQAPEPGSHLKVTAIWATDDGKVRDADIADLDGKRFSSSTLVSPLAFRSAVPKDVMSREVTLHFEADGGSGAWLLDDVYVSNTPAPACEEVNASQVFLPWGDSDYYAGVPGGDFEGSLSWLTEGSPELIAEGSPFEVGGETSSSAVLINEGDSITSPPMCINRFFPHVRFTARSTNGNASRLKVLALWTDSKGKPKVTKLDDQHDDEYTRWEISEKVHLRGALPKDERIHDLQLRFQIDGKSTSWLIDDVYIDPYKRN